MIQRLSYGSDPRYPLCSGAEYQRRHSLLRAAMAEPGLDALLIHGAYRLMYQQNLRWISNSTDSFQAYARGVNPVRPLPATDGEAAQRTARRGDRRSRSDTVSKSSEEIVRREGCGDPERGYRRLHRVRRGDFSIQVLLVYGWDNLPRPPLIGLAVGEHE